FGPVGRSTGADVLNDAEEMQSFDWRRRRLGRGLLSKIDIVDRELIVAIDEVDQALAHAVNRRDVELHRTGAHGDLPCAQVERTPERIVGIADANRKSADDGSLDRLYDARDVGRLRVDDEVHRTLAVDLDFTRTVARRQM